MTGADVALVAAPPRRLSSAGTAGAAAAGAVLAVLCFLRFGFGAHALLGAVFVVVLAVLSAFDLQHRIVPNRIVLPAAAFLLVGNIVRDPGSTLEWTLAALGAAAFLLLPALVYPAGLGMGDVKLALLLGATLGAAVVGAIVLGFVAAAAFGIVLMLRHGAKARRWAIPFGPFLALGGIVALLLS